MKDEFEIGKTVHVYYDPDDPSKNALTDFRDLSMSRFGPVPLLLLLIAAAAWLIHNQRMKSSRISSTRSDPRRQGL
jgi:hypothetical protein